MRAYRDYLGRLTPKVAHSEAEVLDITQSALEEIAGCINQVPLEERFNVLRLALTIAVRASFQVLDVMQRQGIEAAKAIRFSDN